MKQTTFILITLLITSVFTVFSQGKRLPYELREGVTVCDTVYTLPEEKAKFPGGGTSAIYNFFKENSQYSEELVNMNFTRRLTLQLLVDSDGKIINSEALSPLSPEYDEDALDVVTKFPDLAPATMNGRNVCSYLIIPLYYK